MKKPGLCVWLAAFGLGFGLCGAISMLSILLFLFNLKLWIAQNMI
jgi:hypothetical protein